MLNSVSPLPARIAAFAARHHGIVDLEELTGLGASRQTVALWAMRGHLHRIHQGVYAVVPPAMLTIEARWYAAVKACGPRAFLSHGPSGQLSGIVPRKMRYALHVSVLDRSAHRVPGVLLHRPRHLARRDTTVRLGIPTTTATRVVWDMSTDHTHLAVRRALEKAERDGLLDRPRLTELAAAHPTRKGSGVIRRLLAERPLPAAEVRSWLEELLWTTCTDNRLPLPAVNVPLLGYTVDFLWERERFVVEADGGDHLEPTQRDSDNARDCALQRAGHLVRRYSTRDMARPSEVVAEVLGILRQRTLSGR